MIDGYKFRRSCAMAKNIIESVVCRALEARKMHKVQTESYVALESLLCEERDPELIRDEFMNLLLAGRDTSGALLSWAFYVLAREPDLTASLRKEIEEVLGSDDSLPTKAQLRSFTRLDHFICENESFRTAFYDHATMKF